MDVVFSAGCGTVAEPFGGHFHRLNNVTLASVSDCAGPKAASSWATLPSRNRPSAADSGTIPGPAALEAA